jgi:hypothetical protein
VGERRAADAARARQHRRRTDRDGVESANAGRALSYPRLSPTKKSFPEHLFAITIVQNSRNMTSSDLIALPAHAREVQFKHEMYRLDM